MLHHSKDIFRHIPNFGGTFPQSADHSHNLQLQCYASQSKLSVKALTLLICWENRMLLERETATETLLATLKKASSGRGKLVLIEGEAGIGKTALLQSFTRRIESEYKVHWGWNDPLTTPRPLGALQDMATTLGSDISDLLRAGASPDLIFPAVLNALMRSTETMVLIFEDLHWADHATLDFIRFLGRRVSLLNTMIILTIRSTDVDRDHPVMHLLGDLPAAAIARLSMEPLSQPALTELVGDLEKAEALHKVTGGNPFFVTELLAEDSWTEGRLPISIRDAVWARWSRLPRRIRDFLDIISIFPSGASPSVTRVLQGEDDGQIADECIERGLLRRDEKAALVFRHELARQATLERLSPAIQRALHARIEDVLAIEPDADSDPTILSQRLHHAALSNNVTRVLELAPKAATQAALLGAHQQAAAHLTVALKHVALASPSEAAQIYEDWAHETFLAGSVSSDETLHAYTRAIALWRSQEDIQKVGLNLCRLARLHWRRGETDQAVAYTEQAVQELEAHPPSKELALAYSTRSQLLMLQDRFVESIVWGERAIALSNDLEQLETRIHALNNVGTSLMLLGRSGGADRLEESLALSLRHGFHDHASRAYTNLAECCMVFRDFGTADRLMTEGIAFCVQYDLDAAAHYLLGRHAQLRMEQGRLREARMIADGVMSKQDIPRVMRLPALSVLGRVTMRLGLPEGLAILQDALDQGESTGEPQRIIPVRLALIEAWWLSGNREEALKQAEALMALGAEQLSAWDMAELQVWHRRCGFDLPATKPTAAEIPAPRAAELAGDHQLAAELWTSLDQPYEAALALMQITGDGARQSLPRAVRILEEMEARQAAILARRLAVDMGLAQTLPRRRRGPYSTARQHPLGLTNSEQKILTFMVQGLGNKEIARTLSRSFRTVEHQVSSVLSKFNAASRMEVLLRVRSEPWLVDQQPEPESRPANGSQVL